MYYLTLAPALCTPIYPHQAYLDSGAPGKLGPACAIYCTVSSKHHTYPQNTATGCNSYP